MIRISSSLKAKNSTPIFLNLISTILLNSLVASVKSKILISNNVSYLRILSLILKTQYQTLQSVQGLNVHCSGLHTTGNSEQVYIFSTGTFYGGIKN